jgi:hypothetical protein
MKVYISGKIIGLLEKECKEKFVQAERELFFNGHDPINPTKLTVHDTSKESYLDFSMRASKISFKIMMDCDAIWLLDNWEDSIGAKIEVAMAKYLHIPILNEKS